MASLKKERTYVLALSPRAASRLVKVLNIVIRKTNDPICKQIVGEIREQVHGSE